MTAEEIKNYQVNSQQIYTERFFFMFLANYQKQLLDHAEPAEQGQIVSFTGLKEMAYEDAVEAADFYVAKVVARLKSGTKGNQAPPKEFKPMSKDL